jgi:hypothetical protein
MAEIASLVPVANKNSTWPDLLGISLVERLTELVQSWSVSVALASTLSSSATPAELATARNQERRGRRVLHVDYGIALLSAVTVAATIIGLSLFTVATEWKDGPVAIGIAAVLASLFLTVDDPTVPVRSFVVRNFVAVVAATFYVFAILEVIDGFLPLAAALLPILFVIGFFLSSRLTFSKRAPCRRGIFRRSRLSTNLHPGFRNICQPEPSSGHRSSLKSRRRQHDESIARRGAWLIASSARVGAISLRFAALDNSHHGTYGRAECSIGWVC